ncbi:MAG: hypothetical protein IT559_00390 [Alphaproteobacteria bacterium]|nr:hypothetical protein [Alphaproteobacteria bacterium]
MTLALVLIAGAVAFAASQREQDKVYSWRYKMTVEIETPEGIRSGSAVREVDITQKVIGWSDVNKKPHYSTKRNVSGEAVVVDLGERGKIFALIDDRAYADVLRAFDVTGYENAAKLPVGSKTEFKCDGHPYCPKMVTFTDMNDPKTVKLVYVDKTYANGQDQVDSFEEYFGGGVRLKSITVEMTEESITQKIDEYLTDEYYENFKEWWQEASLKEKMLKADLLQFKIGRKNDT